MIKKVIFIICMVFSFFCCAQKQMFTSHTPVEFEELLKGNSSVQLVDVRHLDEYNAGHINNAVLIDVLASDFINRADSILEKSRPVAVYCRSGRRSKDAATKLAKRGFDVHELDSGYNGWTEYIKQK